ncbi:YraN family protein [Campylobacter sp. RM13119]|uniref:YraN family protein n=1 Tax=Campylobacter TaxID=194 RepID=UPI0014759AB9|nr:MULTISPECIES: YraN family protein [unclassified Campylobacter]MBE3607033.1 YraN family protein [Campylobacter sp. RM13119]MBE3610587.1 YraN family protein [Campylobacter sp. RM12916]
MGLVSYLFGKSSEDQACAYLSKMKFQILERNFRSKFGEIDIIAIDKEGILCFIEVKANSLKSNQMGHDAIYRLTPSKYSKILKAVDYYLLKNGADRDYEIDFIVINGKNIELIRNISL